MRVHEPLCVAGVCALLGAFCISLPGYHPRVGWALYAIASACFTLSAALT